MQSLNELEEVIALTFPNSPAKISFEEFMKNIEAKANIFLLLFCYLYLTIPAMDNKLVIYRKKYDKKYSSNNISVKSSSLESTAVNNSPCSVNLAAKKLKMSPSLFSPVTDLRFKQKLSQIGREDLIQKLLSFEKSTHEKNKPNRKTVR